MSCPTSVRLARSQGQRQRRRRRSLLGLALVLVGLIAWCAGMVHARDEPALNQPNDDPLANVTSFAQVAFVSCNRNDADQSYWAVMASVVQCEMADEQTRRDTAECRAMQRGEHPPALSSPRRDTATMGACDAMGGAAYAGSHAAELRSKTDTNAAMTQPPVDAFVWLGDAIYADKPQKGSAKLPMGHVVNSLDEVRRMWEMQRSCAPYTAFRTTCLRSRLALTSELCSNQDTSSSQSEYDSLQKRKQKKDNKQSSGGEGNNNNNNNQVCENVRLGHSQKEDKDEFAVVGTWDDHDMGVNDGGYEYPHKNITQKYLMHFLNASRYDVRWRRPGVYMMHTISFRELADMSAADKKPKKSNTDKKSRSSATYRSDKEAENDEEGNGALSTSLLMMKALSLTYEHAVCLILLDARYFREPANVTRSGDMLGEAQWQWLDERLREDVSDERARADDDNNNNTNNDNRRARAAAGEGRRGYARDGDGRREREDYDRRNGRDSDDAQERQEKEKEKGEREGEERRETNEEKNNDTKRNDDDRRNETQPQRPHIPRARCALTLIGNGIQFMMDEKPTENWAAFPHSRDRLLALLRRHRINRALFLTGDVHMNEIGMDSTAPTVERIMGYPIIEATSSGLTHAEGEITGASTLVPRMLPSPRRVGLYMQRNFATVRLSFPRRLQPHIRSALQLDVDSVDNITSTSTRGGKGVDRTESLCDRVRARAALQRELEALVNVTVSGFALDAGGRPVHRLSVPLHMLTRRRGREFIDARVISTETGYIEQAKERKKSKALR